MRRYIQSSLHASSLSGPVLCEQYASYPRSLAVAEPQLGTEHAVRACVDQELMRVTTQLVWDSVLGQTKRCGSWGQKPESVHPSPSDVFSGMLPTTFVVDLLVRCSRHYCCCWCCCSRCLNSRSSTTKSCYCCLCCDVDGRRKYVGVLAMPSADDRWSHVRASVHPLENLRVSPSLLQRVKCPCL